MNSTVLVILGTYGTPVSYYGPNEALRIMADVDKFYNEASFGKQRFDFSYATPWFRITDPKPANGSVFGVQAQFEAAAKAAGHELTNYEYLIYLIDQGPSFGFSGCAFKGMKRLWINRMESMNPAVVIHELGHALGLEHAGSITGKGVIAEYGDVFDTMGGRTRHFNARQKAILGWVPPPVVFQGGTQTYNLTPIEVGGGACYAVQASVAPDKNCIFEYRVPIGYDAPIPQGLQVRMVPPFGNAATGVDSLLIDVLPETTTFEDGVLATGKTWTEPSGLSVTVTAADATGCTITVSTAGAIPPVVVPPPAPPPYSPKTELVAIRASLDAVIGKL